MDNSGDESDTVLKQRWELGELLGTGSFSMVMIARDRTDGELYAAKVEKRTKDDNGLPQPEATLKLWKEREILQSTKKNRQICDLIDHGITQNLGFLILSKHGPSVKQVLGVGNSLPVINILRLLWQISGALTFLHDLGFVHQDLNPGNILLASENDALNFVLIDFGLARRFGARQIDRDGNEILNVFPTRGRVGDIGAPLFRSVNADKGLDLGPKDDHVSLFNVCEHAVGILPWKLARSFEELENMKRDRWNQGNLIPSLPKPLQEYALHVKQLKFGELADQAKLRTQLVRVAQEQKYSEDDIFGDTMDPNASQSPPPPDVSSNASHNSSSTASTQDSDLPESSADGLEPETDQSQYRKRKSDQVDVPLEKKLAKQS